MHAQRALFEIVHDVRSHLEAGVSEVKVTHDEIADALGTSREEIVQKAIDQICLSNPFNVTFDPEDRCWVFRNA